MFPCTSTTKTADSQVKQMIQDLKDTKYKRIWLDVETHTSPNCGWTKDYEANCKFMRDLVTAVKGQNK